MNKKFLGLIGAVVIGGALLVGCAETSVEKVDGDDKAKAETKKEEKKEDTVFKVGETAKVNGVEITVKSASFTEPAEYSPSENGKVLTLEVSAKNTNKEQAFIDNTEFAIYDKDGNKVGDYFGYDEMALSDNVNSGKNLNGKLYFDVPEQGEYELIYTPTFTLDSKEVKWNIAVQ
jgi:Domain of unknown function (DUF4352)